MSIYSIRDHFMNPCNVEEIDDTDGIGEEGNPVCQGKNKAIDDYLSKQSKKEGE